MAQNLILKTRYYRTRPIDRPGYEEEIVKLDPKETTLIALHCWDIGCPGGPAVDPNYCVGMGLPENLRETWRIVRRYILPAVEASRKAGILVSHIETDVIGEKHPEWHTPKEFAAKYGKKSSPVIQKNHQAMLERCHGKDYLRRPPYSAMDRISLLTPQPGDIFATQTREFDRFLKKHRIKNLIYSGFAADMCILRAPAGAQDMLASGYRVFLIREATLGIEFPDTFRQRISTRWGLRFFECRLGNTISYTDFVKACKLLSRKRIAREKTAG